MSRVPTRKEVMSREPTRDDANTFEEHLVVDYEMVAYAATQEADGFSGWDIAAIGGLAVVGTGAAVDLLTGNSNTGHEIGSGLQVVGALVAINGFARRIGKEYDAYSWRRMAAEKRQKISPSIPTGSQKSFS